ncbi:hypothetical protein [Bacillus wiedmannii]|uniref:hypothetical protein n=1 Tax=Bacillus wiedmannii TaxID=1890302 RepID=UPI000D17B501|nr:hypothetical protein [Bacillus wiedmannii]PTC12242.1 hypothetical protein C6557_17785 [Bacillus wiedmannii]
MRKPFKFEGKDSYGDGYLIDNDGCLVGVATEHYGGSSVGGYLEFNDIELFEKFVQAVNETYKILKEEN